MRRFVVGAVVGLAIAMVGVAGMALVVAARGVSAREAPGRLETFVARQIRHLAIPRRARATPNPVAATPEVLAEGLRHFADHCAVCHANDGSGETAFGRNLYPKPPDLRLPGTQRLSDGELFYIIENGIRFTGMPAFGSPDGTTAADSWALVHVIRRLPHLTADELAEMRRWNPKSAEEIRLEEEARRFLEGGAAPPHPHR